MMITTLMQLHFKMILKLSTTTLDMVCFSRTAMFSETSSVSDKPIEMQLGSGNIDPEGVRRLR